MTWTLRGSAGDREFVSKSWFSIKAKAEAKQAEVYIYDEIGGWGVTAKDFASALKAIPKDHQINLRINSPGGSIVDGSAIYNLLAERTDKVTTLIDGLAASMASVIALAGSKVLMADNALMMIHDPIGWAFGDSEDMRKTADVLDKFGETIVSAYVKRTGKTEEQVKAAMAEETWFTAKEAKDWGLVDTVTDPIKAAATATPHDLQRFRHPPTGASAKADGDPAANRQNQHEDPMFENLIKALVAAKILPHTKLDDKDATAMFEEWNERRGKELTAKDGEITSLKAKVDAGMQKDAERFIAEAVKAGKVKDDEAVKKAWVSAYLKDSAGVTALLDGVQDKKDDKPKKSPTGGDPLPVARGDAAQGGKTLTLTQRCQIARGHAPASN